MINLKNTKKPIFSFSLINTKKCNFNCTYCYEKGKFNNTDITTENIDKLILFFKEINNQGYAIDLTLIGGEPTLSKNNKYLFDSLMLNKIDFNQIRVITNGYSYKLIEDMFSKNFLSLNKNKILIQVSYDGIEVNDFDRIIIDKNNNSKGTSRYILKTIDELMKNNFDVSIKSTLDFKYFKYIPKILKEFQQLGLKYNKYIPYSLTEEKDSILNFSKEEISEQLKKIMSEIIKIEKENVEIFNKPLSKWFTSFNYNDYDKIACQAGHKYFAIDFDLNISFCHHSIYLDIKREENKSIFLNIKDDEPRNIFNELLNIENELNQIKVDDECKNCNAIYCLRCPIYNYDNFDKYNDSETTTINDQNTLNVLYRKFHDERLCFYYQELSKYIHYFNKKILSKGD